ncbi:MAG: hypothetical protein AAGD06_31045, partial [Acidobacteriota bacterium]
AAMVEPAAAPRGWTLITTFGGDRSAKPPQPNGQGMYLTGLDRSTGEPISVLALGMPWGPLVSEYVPISPENPQRQRTAFGDFDRVDGELTPVPEAIVGGDGGGAEVTSLHLVLYSQLWGPLWNQLDSFRSQIDRNQLYVVGLGPAAPLAQLATLDLRSGRRGGPNSSLPPSRQPLSYTFSAAPSANGAFADFYGQNAGTSFAVNAQTPTLTADFFPSAPGADEGYVLPGSIRSIRAKLPAIPDPWAERSGGAYERALGDAASEPQGNLGPAATAGASPDGYDQVVAHALASLCGVANGQRQHPAAVGGGALGPYTLTHRLGRDAWGAVFDHVSGPTVAFRDTVTWQELIGLQMPNPQRTASFLPAGAGQLQTTLLDLYSSLRGPLFEVLGEIALGRPVTFAGYGFGGALASLAALDLRTNAGDLGLRRLYTFGSARLGDRTFSIGFGEAIGGSSFQIARPADFLPPALSFLLYEPLPEQIPLLGTPQDDDPATHHTLASYLELLDPYG